MNDLVRKRTGYPNKDFYLKAVASVTLDPNGNHILFKQTFIPAKGIWDSCPYG